MNRREKLLIVKNAVANVARGAALAVIALVLPAFLARLMSASAFGTWSLVLQIAAYVAYLDFGVQTAVARFVAHATESKDPLKREQIVTTSAVVLGIAGAVGIVGILAVSLALPYAFHQLPAAFLGSARIALVLVGVSLAVGLPASVFNGVFVGLQRNEVPAVIVGGSRILSAGLQVLVVDRGGSLASLGLAVASVNLASYLVQYAAYRGLVPDLRLSIHTVTREAVRELWAYCKSLTVWSFAMVLVSGLDLVLVGVFQYRALAYYAVAVAPVTFIAGFQNAVFGAVLSPSAVLHARGDSRGLGRMVVSGTRFGMLLLLAISLPLLLMPHTILTIWVGAAYARQAVEFLIILVGANMIRLSAVPYVIALIGTGQQTLVIVTPLLEGVTNLVLSVVLGLRYGAVGVAWGTMAGAVVGIAGNFLYNMPRTTQIEFSISGYIRDGLLRPAVCALPVTIIVALAHLAPSWYALASYSEIAIAVAATAVLVWQVGFLDSSHGSLRLRFLASDR